MNMTKLANLMAGILHLGENPLRLRKRTAFPDMRKHDMETREKAEYHKARSTKERKEAFLTRICITENLRRHNAKLEKLGLPPVNAIPKGCAGTLIH